MIESTEDSGPKSPAANPAAGLARAARLAALAVLLLAAAACGRGETGTAAADAVDRETFIDVYIALRRAELETATADAFEARKREILREHGTDVEELAAFVELRGRDVEEMREVWHEIEQRLERQSADTTDA